MSQKITYGGERALAYLDICYACYTDQGGCALAQYAAALLNLNMPTEILAVQKQVAKPKVVVDWFSMINSVPTLSLLCKDRTSDILNPCGKATIVDL